MKPHKSLLSAFDGLLPQRTVKKIPEGFLSVIQIAEDRGRSPVTIQSQLYGLFREGKIRRIKGCNDDGRACWFYRVK